MNFRLKSWDVFSWTAMRGGLFRLDNDFNAVWTDNNGKEYSERFDRIERSVIDERSARESFEALTMQRLNEGNDKFEKLESKVDDLRNSVGNVDNGVAKLSGQIEFLIKMKET